MPVAEDSEAIGVVAILRLDAPVPETFVSSILSNEYHSSPSIGGMTVYDSAFGILQSVHRGRKILGSILKPLSEAALRTGVIFDTLETSAAFSSPTSTCL